MATEEQVQDSSASGEVSVSVTEEKEFALDPSLLALSGNDMQHYCTMLSLLEFENIKPQMFLKTEQGVLPLSLVTVVEDFDAGPWSHEGNESVPFDLPQQGSPGPQVQIQYNFVLHPEGGIPQGNPSSCWPVSESEQGTNLQASEKDESVPSRGNLSVFPQILMGNSKAPFQQWEGFQQPSEMDWTAEQGNAGPASAQNVSGLDLFPGNEQRTGGWKDSVHQITYKEESSPSCDGRRESATESPSPVALERPCAGEMLCSCPKCGRAFSLPGSLVAHQSPHSRDKLYKCPNCRYLFSCYTLGSPEGHGGTFPGDWERDYHLPDLNHTPNPKGVRLQKRFHCPECGRGFVHKSSIPRHQKHHRKENLSQNPGQEKSCSPARKGPLPRPQSKLLAGGRDKDLFAALCEVCGQSFSQAYKFRRHWATHSQERPFCCYHCGKAFSVKSVLARHQLLHQPDKPFCCRYCDKGYIQKSHLNRHYQQIHGVHE